MTCEHSSSLLVMSPLMDRCFAKKFCPVLWLAFPIVCLWKCKKFLFDELQFHVFLLWLVASASNLRKLGRIHDHCDFLRCFPLEVLSFQLYISVYKLFALSFGTCFAGHVRVHFVMDGYPTARASLVERFAFPC